MTLADYTTYDTVRAILGVSAKELRDTTLGLALWVQQFELEMSDVDQGGGAVLTQYATVAAIDPGTRTADQQRFYDLTNMLAAYSVARQMLAPSAMFVAEKISDGRAEVQRFNTNNFDRVRQGVEATYAQLIKRLASLLTTLVPGANVPAAVSRVFILSSALGTDPVTGV